MITPRRARAAIVLAVPIYLCAALVPFRLDLPEWRVNGARRDGGAVEFREPGRLAAEGRVIVAAAREGGRLEVELVVRAATASQLGPARILELGTDHESANLTIGQDGAALVLRVRRPGSDESGTPPLRLDDVFGPHEASSLDVRIELTRTRVSLTAGRLRSGLDVDADLFATWDERATLILGDSPVGGRPWLGRIELARLVVDEAERDLLAPGVLELDAGVIAWPERLRMVFAWRFVPPFRASELLVNVLDFVPIGVLARLGWRRRPRLAAVVVGCGLSLTMELTQLAFAERIPALPDLAANLCGAWLGALAWSRKVGMLREP